MADYTLLDRAFHPHNRKYPYNTGMDAIELTLFTHRIQAICDEMGANLMRSAFSPNIKDRLDFSCAIFDEKGQLCGQAAHIPVHLGSMAYAMSDIVNQFDWQAGDMVILNDPYLGGTHLPDITLIAPLFYKEKLCAFIANRAHHADIGSNTPGSMPLANNVNDEGLVISPKLLINNHQLREQTLSEILQSLHNPDIGRADFNAQISANNYGIERLKSLVAVMSYAEFISALDCLNDYAESLARSRLRNIPQGEYSFSDIMDDDGTGNTNIIIKVTIDIEKDNIGVHFDGTAEQVNGNINCPLSVTAAAVYYCFYCLMPDHTPACAGSFRPIHLSVPTGCFINAKYPAAVAAGNVETSTRIVDVILGALAQAIPENIPAASHGSMNNIAMGTKKWDYYETLGGGMGASAIANGQNAVQTHMTNTLNTPIEILEKYYPLRINKYAIRINSGGKGKHTGGNGLIREYEFLEPCTVTLLTERRASSPWGLQGGNPGSTAINYLNGQILPAKTEITAKKNDRLTIMTAGGGGWGIPA